ncbi:hypothetical protein IQ247_27610 [Plectonema cf. radiosum LEGE 06105]|uniref:Uncharacterized protein n=1 Tax=Plectonema cf. radiosum LEGE 06105 TaxID=945769 RepID=A0A8J7JX71_9CYAN|nr:hypothetical protein [Plectonema radiosum]MBE9216385.1 hypothetical protein [Plectonema cf. radiosum LEGE 06105]
MLTNEEIERLKQGIIATIASPVIGSIEDYAWEAIFHYVKSLPMLDPASGRSKLLYDAVDRENGIGWSLKSLQKSNLLVGSSFLFVIQRADVIKKADSLGFPGLTEKSPPQEIGAAIIKHWNEKIITSCSAQGVRTSYEGILLKTIKGIEYRYCEFPLEPLETDTFSWNWTTNKNTGKLGADLQGSIAGNIELVWYKNQKQLFRARTIPEQAVRINVKRYRLNPAKYVETILSSLEQQFKQDSSDEEDSL